jgi:hypothetical protein
MVFRAPDGREVDEVVYFAPSGDEASLTAPERDGSRARAFAFGLERASGPRPPDEAPPGAEDEGGPPEPGLGGDREPRGPAPGAGRGSAALEHEPG